MTFKDHIETRKKTLSKFRRDICSSLGDMPASTFYYKVANNAFTLPEKALIAKYLDESIDDLFPEYINEVK